ncbi:MAG: hypothetical protein PSN35_06855, partial [Candidatus Thioglobus sp.]|nr:hypothetical protein [Candidatus Thioglobus sp.]
TRLVNLFRVYSILNSLGRVDWLVRRRRRSDKLIYYCHAVRADRSAVGSNYYYKDIFPYIAILKINPVKNN